MRCLKVIVIVFLVVVPGCLEDIKDDFVSCEDTTGACRYEILQSTDFSGLHVEINYVTEHAPDSDAVDLLKHRIHETTDKGSVSVSQNGFGSTDESYSLEEIIAIENEQRTRYKSGNTFVIHILYLNGEYEDNDQTLGLAYTGSSFVLFKEKIEEAELVFISAEEVERSVIVHEYGHLLGLINNGYESPHDHEDPEHPYHSNNEESVMYWSIETLDIFKQLDGSPPDNFDSDDLDDLRLMREGKL
ncbi:MAG: hypothetical protein VYE50_00805 [Candidatus Thermoplasmatota archaeon]|nr:hypothetical protein [Candidatus Thermoplasmatota archaeon]